MYHHSAWPLNPYKGPEWIEKHSVNCFICSALIDERECMPGEDGEGDICPRCQESLIEKALAMYKVMTILVDCVEDMVDACIQNGDMEQARTYQKHTTTAHAILEQIEGNLP